MTHSGARPDGEGQWGEVQGDKVMVWVDWERMTPDLARDLAQWLVESADEAAAKSAAA